MKKFIFILGGARSGKSSYAVELAKRFSRRVSFIATADPLDREMKKRVSMHKASRPRQWRVIEEGRDIGSALAKLKGRYEVVLIDCLGLIISNLMADGLSDKKIEKELKAILKAISSLDCITILVSNEVGSGIVPDNHLARAFRDLLGMANQMIARQANQVILMQSGIAIPIKGEKHAGIG